MADKEMQDEIEIVDLDEDESGEGEKKREQRGGLRKEVKRYGVLVGLMVALIVMAAVVEQGMRAMRPVAEEPNVGEVKEAIEEQRFFLFSFFDEKHVYVNAQAYNNSQPGQGQEMFVLRPENGTMIGKKKVVEGSFVWQTKSGMTILSGEGGDLVVVESASQRVVWRSDVRGSVAFEDESVLYIRTGRMSVVAMEVDTGKVLWEQDEVFAGNIVVGEDLLCLKDSENFAVVSKRDGRVMWKRERESCVVMKEGVVYTNSVDGMIRARAVEDGREIWGKKLKDVSFEGNLDVTSWFLDKDFMMLYVPAHTVDDKRVEAEWRVLRLKDGGDVWSIKQNAWMLGLEAGVVYVQDTNSFAISAYKVEDGQRLWEYHGGKSVVFVRQLVQGVWYLNYGNGLLAALESGTGKELWSGEYGKDGNMQMTLDEGRGMMYAVEDKEMKMRALRMGDGKVLWERKLEA